MAIDVTSQIDTTGLVDNQPATAASAKTPIQNLTTVFNNILNGGQDFEILRGVAISDPAAQALKWLLYFKSDGLYVRAPSGSGGTVTGPLGTGGGGGAPADATYIVQTANGTLSNEQVLASLATGLVKNTTTTGVLSIAANTDIPAFTGAAAGTPGTTGGVAAPAAGDQTKYLRADNTWQTVTATADSEPMIVLRQTANQNTGGGNATSGSWGVRPLVDEAVDTDNLCSLSSNEFTLEAGTYRYVYSGAFNQCAACKMRMYNVTDAGVVTDSESLSAYCPTASTVSQFVANTGRFTLAAQKALRLEYRVGTTRNTDGLGYPTNIDKEVYCVLTLYKEA